MVESIAWITPSTDISRKNCTIHRFYVSPPPSLPPCALDPLLSVPPSYLLYISDEGVVGEEGGGGKQERSRSLCRIRNAVTWCTVRVCNKYTNLLDYGLWNLSQWMVHFHCWDSSLHRCASFSHHPKRLHPPTECHWLVCSRGLPFVSQASP